MVIVACTFSPLSSVLRVKRKQRVKRFKRLRSSLRRNTEDKENGDTESIQGLLFLAQFSFLPNNCPITAQKTMLAILKNPRATIVELSKSTNQSERTIKTHQKLLQESNIIRRVGSKKSGSWEILVK